MALILPHAATVLVFDSGAGGLSIAQEILALTPQLHLIYAPDLAYFPYGTKDDGELTERIIQQLGALYEQYTPDLVVVACNTASTLALDILRSQFPCPFVGVVPAIKPAAAQSRSGVVGVLATSATITRPYTRQLIADFASDKQVILAACDDLVALAEDKILGKKPDLSRITSSLNHLFAQKGGELIDTVVLACTHFPLLTHEFVQWSKQQDRAIVWVDSGNAIAKRVKSLLSAQLAQRKTNSTKLTFAPINEEIMQCYREFLETSLAT